VRQLELALDRGRSILFDRSRDWQRDADGERGGNEQSGRHRVPEFRTGLVGTASFSAKARPAGARATLLFCPSATDLVGERSRGASRASLVLAVISKFAIDNMTNLL
jgi:hypothetical protein